MKTEKKRPSDERRLPETDLRDMPDFFHPALSRERIAQISNSGLAHVGDAVYELLARSRLCVGGASNNRDLHAACVAYVSADAQAEAARTVANHLTPEESEIYRRGRNTHINSVPRNADVAHYHAATGLETLFGWLYLKGEMKRANELFCIIAGENRNAD